MRKLSFACGTASLTSWRARRRHSHRATRPTGASSPRSGAVAATTSDPTAPSQQPPSFAAIAVYRSSERIWVTIVAPAMHPGMPELVQILGVNAADLTAYIVSLETTAPR